MIAARRGELLTGRGPHRPATGLPGSFFIEAATASARRSARSTFPPASFARFSSDQPRRISSANRFG